MAIKRISKTTEKTTNKTTKTYTQTEKEIFSIRRELTVLKTLLASLIIAPEALAESAMVEDSEDKKYVALRFDIEALTDKNLVFRAQPFNALYEELEEKAPLKEASETSKKETKNPEEDWDDVI